MRRALMRRPLALAVATVSVVTTLAAVPGSASAATGTLTVITLGRDGAAVDTQFFVTSSTSHIPYLMSSGKAKIFPKGSYAIATDIHTEKDNTDTLAGVLVNVSGTTKVTIDARAGLPMKVALSPAESSESLYFNAAVCIGDESVAPSAIAWSEPGRVFLIPNASKQFFLATLLATRPEYQQIPTPAPRYIAVTGTTGLPTNYTRTVARSGLTPVAVTLRTGPTNFLYYDLILRPAGGCAENLHEEVTSTWATRQQVYLTPGSWAYHVESYDHDNFRNSPYDITRTYAAGKSYGQAFFTAAWGPGPDLPLVSDRTLHFFAGEMFTDPAFAGHQPRMSDYQMVITLKLGSKLLKTTRGNDYEDSSPSLFAYPLTASGWYSLSVDAHHTRPEITYPSWMLSTRTTLSMRFHADPTKNEVARLFSVAMSCGNLDMTNQATPGSTTPVTLTLAREDQYVPAPGSKLVATTLKSLTAQASFDGGTTWHTLKVTGSGTKWTAQVPNPASGAVTLRTTVTSTTGDSSTTTIYRAYAIS